MKKLIAIAVVFTLLVPFAFAVDIDVGGALRTRLIQGQSEGDVDPTIGSTERWFWFGAGKTNDDNTAGFKVSLNVGDADNYIDGVSIDGNGDIQLSYSGNGNISHGSYGDTWAYGWWQPIEQLFFKIGKIGENGRYWQGAGIVGWDLHSNDLLVHPLFRGYYNGFAGSWLGDSHGFFDNGLGDRFGFQMSILPIDGLAINTGFRFEGTTLEDTVDSLALQAVYSIDGIGQAAVGFRTNTSYQYEWNETSEYKELAVQWKMPIGSAMKIEAGFKYLIEPADARKAPIDIGLGFGYGNPWGDQFWVNSRVGIRIGMDDGDPTAFGIDVVPSYDLGIFRVYVPIGVSMLLPDEGDALLGWNFSPYVRKNMGGIDLWAGLLLFNGSSGQWWQARGFWGSVDENNKNNINWAIPIAIQWAW